MPCRRLSAGVFTAIARKARIGEGNQFPDLVAVFDHARRQGLDDPGQSIQLFLSAHSLVLILFRRPPPGAPAPKK